MTREPKVGDVWVDPENARLLYGRRVGTLHRGNATRARCSTWIARGWYGGEPEFVTAAKSQPDGFLALMYDEGCDVVLVADAQEIDEEGRFKGPTAWIVTDVWEDEAEGVA